MDRFLYYCGNKDLIYLTQQLAQFKVVNLLEYNFISKVNICYAFLEQHIFNMNHYLHLFQIDSVAKEYEDGSHLYTVSFLFLILYKLVLLPWIPCESTYYHS